MANRTKRVARVTTRGDEAPRLDPSLSSVRDCEKVYEAPCLEGLEAEEP